MLIPAQCPLLESPYLLLMRGQKRVRDGMVWLEDMQRFQDFESTALQMIAVRTARSFVSNTKIRLKKHVFQWKQSQQQRFKQMYKPMCKNW